MEQLANLPPLAVIVFGATLALIYGVRYMGLLSGAGASPEKSSATAQVAAVIVDPTALNKLSAAGEALNMTIMESNQIAREKVRTEKQLAEEIDSFREELRIQREIGRRERQ